MNKCKCWWRLIHVSDWYYTLLCCCWILLNMCESLFKMGAFNVQYSSPWQNIFVHSIDSYQNWYYIWSSATFALKLWICNIMDTVLSSNPYSCNILSGLWYRITIWINYTYRWDHTTQANMLHVSLFELIYYQFNYNTHMILFMYFSYYKLKTMMYNV